MNPPSRLSVTCSEVSEQALDLHGRSLIFVMHDHMALRSDLQNMKAGGVTAKVLIVALDVDVGRDYRKSAEELEGFSLRALAGVDDVYTDLELYRGRVQLALTAADIECAYRSGRPAVLMGSEGGKLLEGRLAALRMFHRLGLRHLQLTWAFPNQIANENGLTDFGREVLREMNSLGIIVDVTHIPRRAFEDVLSLSNRPVIVSHGAAAGVTIDLSDEQIRGIASTGGVVGVHFYSTYLLPRGGTWGHVADFGPPEVAEQVQYIASLVGIEHVGLGCDFFPTSGMWQDFQLSQGTTNIAWAIPDLGQMPRITAALLDRGFGEKDVQAVMGLNFLRVCRETFGK